MDISDRIEEGPSGRDTPATPLILRPLHSENFEVRIDDRGAKSGLRGALNSIAQHQPSSPMEQNAFNNLHTVRTIEASVDTLRNMSHFSNDFFMQSPTD